MSEAQPPVTPVDRPVSDDSIRVRQVSHYQFSGTAGAAGDDGTYTLHSFSTRAPGKKS